MDVGQGLVVVPRMLHNVWPEPRRILNWMSSRMQLISSEGLPTQLTRIRIAMAKFA